MSADKEKKQETTEEVLHTTIEKDEKESFRMFCKSYRFDEAWKERGDGDLVLA